MFFIWPRKCARNDLDTSRNAPDMSHEYPVKCPGNVPEILLILWKTPGSLLEKSWKFLENPERILGNSLGRGAQCNLLNGRPVEAPTAGCVTIAPGCYGSFCVVCLQFLSSACPFWGSSATSVGAGAPAAWGLAAGIPLLFLFFW